MDVNIVETESRRWKVERKRGNLVGVGGRGNLESEGGRGNLVGVGGRGNLESGR